VTAATAAVAAAGENVRALKAAGATNADEAVQASVASLKALKAGGGGCTSRTHIACESAWFRFNPWNLTFLGFKPAFIKFVLYHRYFKGELAALEKRAAGGDDAAAEAPRPKPKQQQQKKKPQQQKKKGAGDESAGGGGTSSAEEVRKVRLEKVAAFREGGANPFAYRFDRTHSASKLQATHAALENGAEVEGVVEAVCGRVKARRVFGKLAFLSLEDDGGSIQLYCDKKRIDAVSPGAFKTIVDLVDMGDIVGARGGVGTHSRCLPRRASHPRRPLASSPRTSVPPPRRLGLHSLPGVRLVIHGPYRLSSIEPCFDWKIT
jgi:hypothetical protein